ncbi:MAG: DUF1772 domain-containing protein [Caldilineaceae bacterium]
MSIEPIFLITLLLATLLCTLIAGFILIFAIVVMPGIGTLHDREFLHAFQVIDRVIQNNQPLFVFIWLGSAVALIAAAVLGVIQLAGMACLLLIAAAIIYLFGVQLPTVAINIPLNNRVQTLEMATLDEAASAAERKHFETRWNRWNMIRTALAGLVSVLLLSVLVLI